MAESTATAEAAVGAGTESAAQDNEEENGSWFKTAAGNGAEVNVGIRSRAVSKTGVGADVPKGKFDIWEV